MATTINSIASTERSEILAPRERFKAWEAGLEARAFELGSDLPVEDARLLTVARVFGAGMVNDLDVASANVTYEVIPDLGNPNIRGESRQSGRAQLLNQMKHLQLNTEFTRTVDVTDPFLRPSQETAYVNMNFIRKEKGLKQDFYGSSYAVAVISGAPTDNVAMRVEFLGPHERHQYLTLRGTPDPSTPTVFKWEAYYEEREVDDRSKIHRVPLGSVLNPADFSEKMQSAYANYTIREFTADLLEQASKRDAPNAKNLSN